MALLNMLSTVSQPSGMWQSIILSFDNATGSLIVAILLLTIIIRLILAPLDTTNKYVMKKQQQVTAKMQPELDAVEKYKDTNPALYNQKRTEIQQRYSSKMMGGCIVMLLMLVLQPLIFLTLWSGMSSVADYKMILQYENVKQDYANVLCITEDENIIDADTGKNKLNDIVSIDMIDGKVVVTLNNDNDGEIINLDYQTEISNEKLNDLINTYTKQTKQTHDEITGENIYQSNESYNENLTNLANKMAISSYKQNQTSFLWIKNIYKADSPLQSSVFDYSTISSKLEPTYVLEKTEGQTDEEYAEANAQYVNLQKEYEENIYNAFMTQVDQNNTGVNGYFILAIIAGGLSYLSIFISTRISKKSNPNQPVQQSKGMKIIMPIIMGVFSLLYTSIFALYIIFGQIMQMILMPLENLIIEKISKKKEQNKKAKQEVVVDYRRK